MVELIRDPQDPLSLSFLLWQSGLPTVLKTVERDGQIILPPRISAQKIRALTLPTGAQPGGLPKDLIADIATTISRYVELDEHALRLISHFVLYTWMQDLLPSATYLWIVEPLGGEKLSFASAELYVSSRTIRRFQSGVALLLSDELQPTFIRDECDFRKSDAEFLRFLRADDTQDASVFRNGEVYRAFGAKVLASRQPPADAALRSRAAFISMAPMCEMFFHLVPSKRSASRSDFKVDFGFVLRPTASCRIPKLPQWRCCAHAGCWRA